MLLLHDTLRPIFDEYHVHRAVLFGSYAKGCATEKSDVDIPVQLYEDGDLHYMLPFAL
ncbi:MAG: nucleotidyltransferase domain-containing protein [Lachnospiraceae bacterium]|nr:nucleotidyltransferase domain-containing protein [Lachnospiraceae bacterium]